MDKKKDLGKSKCLISIGNKPEKDSYVRICRIISVGITVIYAIWITHEPWCLLGLIFA